MIKSLLILEDDSRLRDVLKSEFEDHGLQVHAFAKWSQVVKDAHFDGVLLDLRLEQESGFDILVQIKKTWPTSRVVMMSGYGAVASAVKAMQLGAHHFLMKPVTADHVLKAFMDTNQSGATEEESTMTLDRMEREYIDYILQGSEGNITQAAKKLGLHRQSLQRKLRKNIPRK
jgi:two-component system response regulator RegA